MLMKCPQIRVCKDESSVGGRGYCTASAEVVAERGFVVVRDELQGVLRALRGAASWRIGVLQVMLLSGGCNTGWNVSRLGGCKQAGGGVAVNFVSVAGCSFR
eukprot:TRINITY_DN93624_c0_g1_i1.p3 TRINITY_DN93624_c0_g1~~TRINITY_DN93624_c0_g1_i1.p3  ORF type:complete len:102 (-),score=2.50 TRINITY_DN93624_c0_g1_i1:196-501(-)